MIRYVLAFVATLALSIGGLPAQTTAPSLATDPAAGHQPLLRLDGFFADRDLQRAVESGLPLRVRVRVELWKDRFIDQLTGNQTWNAVLSYDPLEKTFRVRSFGNPSIDRQLPSYTDARAALEAARTFSLRPLSSGRYYYTATIEVETLSLSDLEELERWLQGQLKPAVSGDRSVPDAIGDGAKRLLIRVLALPTKTQELRTPRFRVQAS
ncbi:MAG: DUF4390 domain-containing protein [Gemmatimonadota bacterium]